MADLLFHIITIQHTEHIAGAVKGVHCPAVLSAANALAVCGDVYHLVKKCQVLNSGFFLLLCHVYHPFRFCIYSISHIFAYCNTFFALFIICLQFI